MQISQDTDEFAALAEASAAPSHTVVPLTDWTIAPAVFGSGTILVGPAADGPSCGTRAVVPPGVWGRSPDGAARAFERTGWRVYRWAPERLIDQHRPVELDRLTLAGVCDVLREAPKELLWVERTVLAQLRVLNSLAGRPPVDAKGSQLEVAQRREALRREAEEAFGRAPSSPSCSPEDLATSSWPAPREGASTPGLDL